MCVILAIIVFKCSNFCIIVLIKVMPVTCTHLIAACVLVHVTNITSGDEPAQVSSVWCVSCLFEQLLQKEVLLVCLEKEDMPLTCSPFPPGEVGGAGGDAVHVRTLTCDNQSTTLSDLEAGE